MAPDDFIPSNGGWWKIFSALIVAALIGLVATTIDHSQRLAVLESGPKGSEIITRLVTIETQLIQIRQYLDEERNGRRGN